MVDAAASAPFEPPWWLRDPHAQTLAAFLFPPRPALPWRRERLELADGDFLDLAHLDQGNGPRVCLFHGLEGCIDSHYIGGLAAALQARGLRVSFMHLRGCSGEPNRLARAYHSGDTGDIGHFVATLTAREPRVPLAAVGFSLSGNALLKYLGEQGADTPLRAAVAVSVPFDLAVAADRIGRGLSRIYQAYFLRRMKRSARASAARLGHAPFDRRRMEAARSFHAYDDAVTAPLHGFAGADDYYARASARPWLGRIRLPTLILHARDDPFVGRSAIPAAEEVSASVELACSEHGGHVGFVAADGRGRPLRWLDRRIPAWLAGQPALQPLRDAG